MPYNDKQYDAASAFLTGGDSNVTAHWDAIRLQTYDLYEGLYRNAVKDLKVQLRGDDQESIVMPNARKIIEATNRFLAKSVDYVVEPVGDGGAQFELNEWWRLFWYREKFSAKFNSNKRWGLIRGDAYFYLYANPAKFPTQRISIDELDPRQVFEIEDDPTDPKRLTGVHIVDQVQDWREPDKPEKKVARRRTFRKVINNDAVVGITSELTFYELGKWDDRTPQAADKMSRIVNADRDEPAELLPYPISELPVYKWSNEPISQNSSWGTSQLTGLETLVYAINQSLSDEDAVLVFQGLGMYVTDAAPPLDPGTVKSPIGISAQNRSSRFHKARLLIESPEFHR